MRVKKQATLMKTGKKNNRALFALPAPSSSTATNSTILLLFLQSTCRDTRRALMTNGGHLDGMSPQEKKKFYREALR